MNPYDQQNEHFWMEQSIDEQSLTLKTTRLTKTKGKKNTAPRSELLVLF